MTRITIIVFQWLNDEQRNELNAYRMTGADDDQLRKLVKKYFFAQSESDQSALKSEWMGKYLQKQFESKVIEQNAKIVCNL